MKTLITGSIAYDTIMVFPDRFRNPTTSSTSAAIRW